MSDDLSNDQGRAPLNPDETPAIYSLGQIDGNLAFNRRTFLEIAAVAAGAAAFSGGGTALGGPGPTPANKKSVAALMANALAHKEPITTLAVNATGKLLASGDKGGNLRLWQLPEGALLQSWSGHQFPIANLAFPHKGNTLWSLDSSGNLKRWNLPDGKEILDGQFTLNSSGNGHVFAVPSAEDWFAVRTADQSVELRSQTTDETLHSLNILNDSINALAVTPNGHILLAGGKHGHVSLWTLPHAHKTQTSPAEVSALAIAPNGALALSAHADGRLRLWHLPELRPGKTYKSPLGKPLSIAIRPQMDMFVMGSEKHEVGLWQLAASTPQLLKGHAAAVNAVAITPDGSLLISGSEDKTIRLWLLPTGKLLRNLIDLTINYRHVEGSKYEGTDVYGRNIVFTLPCGSPMPPGAVCICNCVPGELAMPENYTQHYNSGGSCTCDLICTCNSVCTCQSVGRGGYGGYSTAYWYPN